jgi:hypothetical protein
MIDLPALRTEIETVTGLTIAGGGRDGSELWVEFETTEGVDDIALAETVREAVAAHTPQESPISTRSSRRPAECGRVRTRSRWRSHRRSSPGSSSSSPVIFANWL